MTPSDPAGLRDGPVAGAPSFASPNRLIIGENLAIMQQLPPDSLALIYADPPFFTGRRYRHTNEDQRGAVAFDDIWEGGLQPYLGWLTVRLDAMRRLLRPEGSLFVHLDRRAVHYVKVEMDRIFGPGRMVNEIIWHYTGGGRSKRYFSNKHDTLLWYSRGPGWTFNLDAVRVPYKPTSGYARDGIVSAGGKRYLPNPGGTPVDDVWDIPIVNPLDRRRTGYPTQKPEALLERIIAAASHPGDVVGDFFCGSGTTPAVAQRLGRRWIACDTAATAIATTSARLDALRAAEETAGRPAASFVVERWSADHAENHGPT